jgi:cytochrome c-type biogenesis protein CcmH/NrfG
VRALREAEKCIAQWPRSAAAHVQLGAAYARQQQPDAARRAFTAALDLEPASMDALEGLTALDIQAKRADRAQARIEARLRQAADSVPLWL